jgi:DNA polymerase I-like protein with 3'-5' exonuclease and polymerase domains
MAEPDGSQIEFRCAALLGDDEQAIADIRDPAFDAHLLTAAKIHDCSVEDVKRQKVEAEAAGEDSWRQLCKPDTYKPLYGGKYGTPGQERYYKYFRQRYAGIARAQDQWVEAAVDQKRTQSPWGLTYYWPYAKRAANGSVNCETNVNNYFIQALATAEIVPIAVVYLWHRLAERGLQDSVRIVNMVHDSAPCELHPDAAGAFEVLVKQVFTHDVYHYLRHVYGMKFDKVPLGVGLKIGSHWGTGPETSFDIYSNGHEVKRK